jgi:hypothetical protein
MRQIAAKQMTSRARISARPLSAISNTRWHQADSPKYCAWCQRTILEGATVTDSANGAPAGPASSRRPWVVFRSFQGWRPTDLGADAVAGLTFPASRAVAICSGIAIAAKHNDKCQRWFALDRPNTS